MKQPIQLVYRKFHHFGAHCGYDRFIRHLSDPAFTASFKPIDLGSPQSLAAMENAASTTRVTQIKRTITRLAGQVVGPVFDSLAPPNYRPRHLKPEMQLWYRQARSSFKLIHHLYTEETLWLSPLLFRLYPRRRPLLVGTFHLPPERYHSPLYLKQLSLLDHAIALTDTMATFLQKHIPEKRITVIPHGVDYEHFQPAPEKRHSKTTRILMVGSHLRDETTIRETIKLLTYIRDVEVHLIGFKLDPPAPQKNLFIHHQVSDIELLEHYQKAHVLFLPLKAAQASNTILEAMSCGLPTVVTDLPSVREYLSDQETVFLKENDPKHFAEAILSLIREQEKWQAFSTANRKRAQQYSMQNIARQHATLYRTLLLDKAEQPL